MSATMPVLRRAGRADAATIARLVAEGMDGYRSFAPAGWAPHDAEHEAVRIEDQLRIRGAWATVAEEDGRAVGVVAFLPHHLQAGLAHFWLLFIAESHWGTGLATRMHALGLEAARGAGHVRSRLYTPEGQVRARAFYRREGWVQHGEAIHEPNLGLDLVELRRML